MGRIPFIILSLAFLVSAFAQSPPTSPTGVESTHEVAQGEVLKVYSAEQNEHRFVAYVVSWNGVEIVVSDPLANSHLQVGDKINFMSQQISINKNAEYPVDSLSFVILPGSRHALIPSP
jgi:hypothetical protein